MKEGLLTILKFFCFLLILPLIVAVVLAFQSQILGLPVASEQWFLWGVVVFVGIYLFLYHFREVYDFGQNITVSLFKFYQPLASISPMVISIYTVLLVCLCLVLNIIGLGAPYEKYLVLALGFTTAMHLVMTAQYLYEADSGPIKAHYFLVFGASLVAYLFILSVLLGCTVSGFSFLDFLGALAGHTKDYYQHIYRALFVAP